MLSLVLGSSTHAFELMLSAFILGLAFGGLWIRRRIDRLRDPLRAARPMHVRVMGIARGRSRCRVYGFTFDVDGVRRCDAFAPTDAGYAGFNLLEPRASRRR